MELDVEVVQGIVNDLRRSARVVSDAASRIAKAGEGFDSSAAGTSYRAEGDRISRALAGVSGRVYGWANCTLDTSEVLGKVVSANVAEDQSTATGIGSKTEMLA